MRVLWIVNMLLPDAAEHLGTGTGASGTWMIDISRRLAEAEDVELAVACVYGSTFQSFDWKGIRYYLLPGTGRQMLFYTKRFEPLWKRIYEEFKPDIVHIHGTEYSHGLSFLRACPEAKSVISIQGILTRIKDVDFAEIPIKHFIFGRTISQNLRMNGEIELHFVHKKNAKYEQEMLRRVGYINAVNEWDSSVCKSINSSLKVFRLEYNLRDSFYRSRKWSYDKAEPYRIFTNPAGVPLKGLHKLLEAVALLKGKYTGIKVYVPGMSRGGGKLAITSAYAKYIARLIKKYDLDENVVFLGRLSETEMLEQMLLANVVVIPSAIEGASLILREAMYLGCPTVAAFRGGMPEFIDDKQNGFLYDFSESPYLAARLAKIFEDRTLCERFSVAAIEKAEKAHDREKNIQEYISMYRTIQNEKESEEE